MGDMTEEAYDLKTRRRYDLNKRLTELRSAVESALSCFTNVRFIIERGFRGIEEEGRDLDMEEVVALCSAPVYIERGCCFRPEADQVPVPTPERGGWWELTEDSIREGFRNRWRWSRLYLAVQKAVINLPPCPDHPEKVDIW